jgi:phage gp29-like protein
MEENKPAKVITHEVATADYGMMATHSYTNMLIENPDTVLERKGQNWEIYDELLRDDQVKSTLQQRRSGLTSKSWFCEPATDSAEDKAASDFLQSQLERIDWDNITDKMLYGIFYGFAVGEAMWDVYEGKIGLTNIKVRDRSRFKFNKDHALYLIDSDTPAGKLMPDRKFWTYSYGASHDDNPYGLGLAHSLYWPVFFKRSGVKFWMVFLEKFGMPTAAMRMADGQMSEPKQMERAKQALRAIQNDSGVVIPDSMTLELIEAARSGTADYDGMCTRMDKAISKVVLSQTMTTDDGSSLSQANVHKAVSMDVIDADSDLIAESFRNTIATWLTQWNFPNAGVPFVRRNTEPEQDLTERAERDSKIHALGYDPTDEYIEETYGPGWEKREAPQIEPGTLQSGQGPLPDNFTEVSKLIARRAGNRSDQQDMKDAARYLAGTYDSIYGKRVEQLIGYLEESGDMATFEKHINTMMGEAASEQSVEAVQKATVYGRLMGMLRGQRD